MKSLKMATLNLMFSILFIACMAMLFTSYTGCPFLISFAGFLLIASFIKPAEGVLMETVVKPLSEQLSDMRTALENQLSTKAQAEVKAQLKEFETQVKELENKVSKEEFKSLNDTFEEVKKLAEELKEWKVKTDESYKKDREWIDKQIARGGKKQMGSEGEVKSFNQILGEAIEANADKISGYGKGHPELKIDLMPEVKEVSPDTKKREVKAVGDMSVSSNFPTATTALTVDQRWNEMIMSPYNRQWLSDILPNGTSNGRSVIYPKENGGEGAAALWEDPTEDKAQIDFDLTTQTAPFKWIAGFVIIDRDMLDDIPFLTSYIQNKMLISLKTAENSFILNGANSTSDRVPGLRYSATAYSGSQTDAVKVLLDAAWGQIVEDTNQFYSPTHAILRPRDAVTKIGLHTASGSGEFDLPDGSVVFQNGKLIVGGVTVVPTAQIPAADDFMVLDASAAMFIRRMVPELRVFEDSILAKKNKVMFRIEERATVIVFNNNAIVTGKLTGGTSW